MAIFASSGVSIFNSGTITGFRGTAIEFGGTGNTLTLAPTSIIHGNVLGTGADTFQLGGTGNGSFDLSTIGAAQQYRGFGTFNVIGGTWTVSNTFGQTSPWTVENGAALVVDGSLASSSLITVNSGGALHGSGTVGNTVINTGGFLVPGPVGVAGSSLTVAGSLAFQSGAFYVVQLNPSTASTTNVTGTAALAGTVVADFASGSYVNHSYTILTAAGGVSGTFNALATFGLPADFAASLHYTANSALLHIMAELVPEQPEPPLPPGEIPEIPGGPTLPEQPPPFFTVNQLNVGHAIDNFFNSGGALPPEFVNLFNLTGTNLTNALTQLSGENATGAERSSFELMNGFMNLMLDPHVPVSCDSMQCRELSAIGFAPEQQAGLPPEIALAYGAVFKAPPKPVPIFDQRWTAWASAFGGGSTAKGDPIIGSNDVRTNTFGYAAGMDYHFSPGTVLGFALAGGGTSWNLAQGLGSGRSDAFLAGIYGVTHQGPVYLAGSLAFANNWFSTDRTALGDQLTAKFQGQSYAARLEGGYRFVVPAASNAIGITPYAALQAQNFRTPSYSETDLSGGGFGLTYAAMNGTDTRSELGGRFDDLTTIRAMPLILRGRVAWAHDWVSNPALNASFQSLPGASFTVFGAPIPHDSALTSASAQLFFTPNWSVLVKFDGEFASTAQTYAGSGTLRYTW
ncbi:autotransporter outer membrane beta-barrel domain-containing protein [Bradyrhizobium sp. McL0616]|uniref:autotransporter family protein n=1 Tax=Bradyrhizobium sp. McL0616 TaxID=3415674 RepID=UPI003CFA605E